MLANMNLGEIASICGARIEGASPGDPGRDLGRVEVSDLAYDSRSVTPRTLFFCFPGAKLDRHDFAGDAVHRGAAAIVVEKVLDLDVPQLLVGDARIAMNRLAAPFFGHPSARLKMIGVTGTNGKTTTSYLLHSILSMQGLAGLIGTIEVRAASEISMGVRTTPESIDLQRWLATMVVEGCASCAMEVTSIGIERDRIHGTEFDVAVFTNLTRDHLDHHQTMESYYLAKRDLFTKERAGAALINAEDEWGRRLLNEIEVQAFSYGLATAADFRAIEVRPDPEGSSFRAVGPDLELEIRVNIAATFNVSNALAAAAAAHLVKIPPADIAKGIEAIKGVPGRFQTIDAGQDFTVIVDYAHNPDGLDGVLQEARAITENGGRVIAVFGCGGDRDRTKRPIMGEVAARRADLVIVTSDNPRSEDPISIMQEIEPGVVKSPPPLGYKLIVDRANAIEEAIRSAQPGDVLVIAGKGHETGEEFADHTIPFEDSVVALEALRRL